MCLTFILRPTKIIIKGVELKIKVCSDKKKEEEEEKEKKRGTKTNSIRFVISTNKLIIWPYSKQICVRLLKR